MQEFCENLSDEERYLNLNRANLICRYKTHLRNKFLQSNITITHHILNSKYLHRHFPFLSDMNLLFQFLNISMLFY